MASLLSIEENEELSSTFQSLHDTFARDVVVYKTPEKVSIVTNDDFISIYRGARQGQNYDFSSQEVSGVFPMRIRWVDPKEEKNFPTDSDMSKQVCRMKMRKDAFDFLRGSQSIFIDEVSCEIIAGYKPHGLINIDFYTLYAKRRDMQ